jgi:hypothetical protein
MGHLFVIPSEYTEQWRPCLIFKSRLKVLKAASSIFEAGVPFCAAEVTHVFKAWLQSQFATNHAETDLPASIHNAPKALG